MGIITIYIYILCCSSSFSETRFPANPCKIINFNGNELIWLDRTLNWPPNIIFRQGSKPKWLQIQRNLLENTQNHPPKKSQKSNNVKFSENRFCVGKLFRQKSTSYGSSGRSAKWKMLVHWSSVFHTFCKNEISTIKKRTVTRCFDLNPSFS